VSPRPSYPGSGLKGPGQDIFPEQAKESGRRLGLVVGELQLLDYTPTNEAGSTKPAWTPGATVRGRIDPVGSASGPSLMGGAINEASTHLITFDDQVEITTQDRVRGLGHDWRITALRERTERLVTRVEAARV
jgi:hypothetical protein